MTERIYIGETVTLPIDLDTSLTDSDYNLSEITVIFRIAPVGTDVAAVQVTCDVTGETTGHVDVDLATADTAKLDPGKHSWQLIDSTNTLVLAEGTIQVSTMLAAVGTQTTAGDLDLTWEQYQDRGYGPIPERDWLRYRYEAQRLLYDVTIGKSDDPADTITDATRLAAAKERLKEALCRCADVLYFVMTGVSSESFHSYSVSYGEPKTRADAEALAILTLSNTGLCYRGIQQ